ncbi:rhomboid family intramembrane serine protease [Phaeodactylibacter sp.]|uniref:rhomboid family intramembrane serine protease n=1 Tax=Phaeodactylibacter sp. TaxID=1940289 RepID=UPI0025E94041|nr:rhomboid family intramembrane serine protease [Phaeodactylibacter sp.]MCI4649424.1 rhomboid family intramembrane serine protease [Phaeodactylibacter sp.]MCI5090623.1 rhomboid family intramembrane serine protease [Phaeodactylibacter sp.]
MSISLTIILIGITALISYQAFNNRELFYKSAFHPASIKEFGQISRFLTTGFIHASWGHLAINMYVLYLFGDILEQIFTQWLFSPAIGRIVFLVFYLSAIVVSDIPSYFKHQDNHGYSAVGASGATSALVMAYILFDPWNWFIFPPVPGVILAIGYLWYSSYMSKHGEDLIAHDAHLWGAVYGITFMILLAALTQPELLTMFWERFMEGPRMPNF